MAILGETLARTAEDTLATREPLTPAQLAWRRFRRHKMAMLGLILLGVVIVYVVGGSFVFSEEYANYNDLNLILDAPSRAHPSVPTPLGETSWPVPFMVGKSRC